MARAEEYEVPPEGPRVPIVQISDRLAELLLEISANIKTGPVRMHKVRGTLGAQHAGRTRRTRRVQAEGYRVGKRHTCFLGGDFETLGNLMQTDVGAFS